MKINDIVARLEKAGDVEAANAIKAAVKDIKANWLTRDEVSKLCPVCAEKMQAMGIKRVKASVIEAAIVSAAPALPKGWTKDSAKQAWKTMTEGKEHKLTECAKKMKGKISDEWAFCKWLSGFAGYEPK